MDSVSVLMMEKLIRLYKEEYNEDLKHEDFISESFQECVPEDRASYLYDQFTKDGFFSDLRPFPGATEALERLHNAGHEIIFVTVAPHNSRTASYDKLMWLEKHFPFLEPLKQRLVIAARKDLVLGHILFDDRATNIEAFSAAGGLTCVMDHPWNKEVKGNFRVDNWSDFERVVQHVQILALRAGE